MKILSKIECYKKYNQGLFGNTPLKWNTLEELQKSNYRGQISIRGLGISRDKVKYQVPFENVEQNIKNYKKCGIAPESLRFNQSMPDEKLILQGEVMRGMLGLDLTYTTIKKPMNIALKEKEKYTSGIISQQILRTILSPPSFSDLDALLEIYPKSIIEFSAYSCEVGNIPGRNTIIWEVRNY